MRTAFGLTLCFASLCATGCPPAAPVVVGAAGKAARYVAPIVGEFLLNKAMEALWSAKTGKPDDPKKVQERLAALEEEVKKLNPEFAGPIRELSTKVGPETTWEEYKTMADATVSRVDAIEARVSILEGQVKDLQGRVEKLERTGDGRVTIRCQTGVMPNVTAFLEVDGQRTADWPARTDEVTVTLLSGPHRIVVRSKVQEKGKVAYFHHDFGTVDVVAGSNPKVLTFDRAYPDPKARW